MQSRLILSTSISASIKLCLENKDLYFYVLEACFLYIMETTKGKSFKHNSRQSNKDPDN